MIHNEDVRVHYMDFPTTIGARTVPNEDGTYDIFINSRYGQNGQLKALKHELEHIHRFDYDYDVYDSVQNIELVAHGIEPVAIEPEKKPIMTQDEIQERIENLRKRHEKRKRKYRKYLKFRKVAEIFGFGKNGDLHGEN